MTTETTTRSPVIRTSWGFFANSILAAALAIALSRLVEQFSIAVTGALLDREPVLDQIVTTFRAGGSDLARLGGPVGSFLVGLALLLLYPGAKERGAGRLLMLWMILFTFRTAFSDLALVPFDGSESAVRAALEGASLPAGLDYVIAAAGILGMLLVALAATSAFLGFCRHRSEVYTPRERIRFVASIALLPALASPLLAVLFLLPDQGTGVLTGLPLIGVFTIVTLLAAPSTRTIRIPELAEERGLSIGLLVTFGAVLVLFRLLLDPGVPIPPWDADLNFTLRP